jgi:hypothetical protein
MEITNSPIVPNNLSSSSNLKLLAVGEILPTPMHVSKPEHVQHQKKNPSGNTVELSNEAQAQISMLKARDAQVRQHEQAHLAASAGLDVSSASYTYQKGPNGVQYAVAGDVRIDTSPGRTPEDTLARAHMIMDAALAPADPSAADRRVALQAQQMAQQASAELLQQSRQVEEPKQTVSRHSSSTAYDDSKPPHKQIDTFA